MPNSKTTGRTTPRKPDETPAVTSADAYRTKQREQGFPLALPTGAVFQVRRTMDLLKLAQTGRIPNPLGNLVAEAILSRGTKPIVMEEQPPEVVPQLFNLIDDVVINMVLVPPIVKPYVARDDSPEELAKMQGWIPSPGYLSVEEVDMMDKMFLFSVAMGGATDLEQFRKQAETVVASSPDGEGVLAIPE